MTDFDPAKAISHAAIEAHTNGGLKPAPPPLILELSNSEITVVDATNNADGAPLKLIRVAHASGGLHVMIPLPRAAAREVGNALCDRPNITLP